MERLTDLETKIADALLEAPELNDYVRCGAIAKHLVRVLARPSVIEALIQEAESRGYYTA